MTALPALFYFGYGEIGRGSVFFLFSSEIAPHTLLITERVNPLQSFADHVCRRICFILCKGLFLFSEAVYAARESADDRHSCK